MKKNNNKLVFCLVALIVLVILCVRSDKRVADNNVEARISQLTGVPFQDVDSWFAKGIEDKTIVIESTYYSVYRDGKVPSKGASGFNARVPESMKLHPTKGVLTYVKAEPSTKISETAEEPDPEPDVQAVEMLTLHSWDKNPKGIATEDVLFVRPDQTMPGESIEDELEYHSKGSPTYRLVTTISFQELPDFMQRGLEIVSKKDVGRSLADILGCRQKEFLRIRSVDKATSKEHCQRDVECFLKEISDDKRNIVIETGDFNFIDGPVGDDLVREMTRLYGVTWVFVPEGTKILATPVIERKEVQP